LGGEGDGGGIWSLKAIFVPEFQSIIVLVAGSATLVPKDFGWLGRSGSDNSRRTMILPCESRASRAVDSRVIVVPSSSLWTVVVLKVAV
jgi:hypothetical protein